MRTPAIIIFTTDIGRELFTREIGGERGKMAPQHLFGVLQKALAQRQVFQLADALEDPTVGNMLLLPAVA